MISWPNCRSRIPPRASSRSCRDQAEEVPPGRVAVEAEEQVRGELRWKKLSGVRLDDLAEVHQPAELHGGRRRMSRP